MRVRQSTLEDLPQIMYTIRCGRQIQQSHNNLVQWNDEYPNESIMQADISKGYSYLVVSDEHEPHLERDTVLAIFTLLEEPDPTYDHLSGQWLSDDPYVTIHRIASNRRIKGAGRFGFDWVLAHYNNIRIDTHENNPTMRHLIESAGFVYCGEIISHDGKPRRAYQLIK